MPVFNEARFIDDALESLTGQTYPELRITVLDNASDDGTYEVAARYARRCSSVDVVRRDQNVGALENFNDAARRAHGKYFMWAGGHDRWSPEYVERLVSALEDDSDAVLAFGNLCWIAEDGRPAEGPASHAVVMDKVRNPVRRFNLMMWADANPIHGLVRADALHRTDLLRHSMAPGQVFLSQLAIMGSVRYVSEATFFRRRTRPKEKSSARVRRYSTTLFPAPLRSRLPHWRLPLEFIRAAAVTPLPAGTQTKRQQRALLLWSSLNAVARFWPYMQQNVSELADQWRSHPRHSR